MHIEIWPIRWLIPYEKNARIIPQAAIDKVAASLKEFGWQQPIVADKHGVIIVGHVRRLGALELGWEKCPVYVARDLTAKQVRQYRLMDNRSHEEAVWDKDLLRFELGELEPLDLGLTGFDLPEIEELLSQPVADDEPVKTAHVSALIERAWIMIADDWRKVGTPDFKWLSPDLTPGVAAWYFVQAKYIGSKYPGKLSLAFTPGQIMASADKGSPIELLESISSGKIHLLSGLRFNLKETPDWGQFTTSGLPMCGHKRPLDFPPGTARELIDKYCPSGGAVLDPCHGWGGRCVGFLLSEKPLRYVGCDPSEAAHDGVTRLTESLKSFAEPEKTISLLALPFEDFETEERFDFALTSPPYFDNEQYDGELSSFRRYPTWIAWVDGFYTPLIQKTYALLKSDCCFALQVGSQAYPMAETGKDIARAAGFILESSKAQVMSNLLSETGDDESESLFLFRKP